MANHVGPVLSRLIRERAYQSGDLKRITQEELEAREAAKAALSILKDLCQRRRLIQTRIDELDGQISQRADFDPTAIRPVCATPKSDLFEHGEFTTLLVKILKDAGQPIPTGSIIQGMIDAFGLPHGTPADREATRRKVTERLRVLARKGAIQRLHALDSNHEGWWNWIGL